MKRVERRGALESQQQQIANQSTQQHQQHQLRSTSHPKLPLSQGSSDRFIHRLDTILMHQPSHNPFFQSQSHSQTSRDRDTSSSHTQSNIRSSLSSLTSIHPLPPPPLPLKSQFLILHSTAPPTSTTATKPTPFHRCSKRR